ncbi:hypothetical protein SARC_12950, partial [Sphaeroforma arctica JP610]
RLPPVLALYCIVACITVYCNTVAVLSEGAPRFFIEMSEKFEIPRPENFFLNMQTYTNSRCCHTVIHNSTRYSVYIKYLKHASRSYISSLQMGTAVPESKPAIVTVSALVRVPFESEVVYLLLYFSLLSKISLLASFSTDITEIQGRRLKNPHCLEY